MGEWDIEGNAASRADAVHRRSVVVDSPPTSRGQHPTSTVKMLLNVEMGHIKA